MFIREIPPLGFAVCAAIVVACSSNTNSTGLPMRAVSMGHYRDAQPMHETPPPKGWQFYTPNPFASPICPSDPCSPTLDKDSAAKVTQMMHGKFSMGIIQVAQPGTGGGEAESDEVAMYYDRGHAPRYAIDCTKRYTPRCYGNKGLFENVPIPTDAYASADVDHHASMVVKVHGQPFYEDDFWEFHCYATPSPNVRNRDKCIGTTYPVSGGGTVIIAYGGACKENSFANRGTCRGSAIAAGVPTQPGLLDPRELKDGPIKHVLYVAVGCPNGAYVWPAGNSDGYPQNCRVDGGPAEGERVWLDLTDDKIGHLSDPRWVKVILHTMHHYGFMVIDTAGDFKQPWNFYGLDSATFTYIGLTDPWATFFDSIGCQAPSNPCGYSKDASHLRIPLTGIKESDIHVLHL